MCLDCLTLLNRFFWCYFPYFLTLSCILLGRVIFLPIKRFCSRTLSSFSNCIEFDWTVHLVIYYLLNLSPNLVC